MADRFRSWGIENDYFARLVISELVTNAWRHGKGEIVVRVAHDGCGPLIQVRDDSPELPEARHEDHSAEDGRGLITVADLTTEWGVRPCEDSGKIVWARPRRDSTFRDPAVHHAQMPLQPQEQGDPGTLLAFGGWWEPSGIVRRWAVGCWGQVGTLRVTLAVGGRRYAAGVVAWA
ncbi:ATP-binding protein [Actinomadura barringtoniae]|uniref:ATP-binding protein n=1 Tax=Actinomadura barringtoniae TaxID=1427535 RepID=A0A939PK33_9ACTN|nr:ATP-binding protein [Actinomadura barringtoniae]MBO2454377.1 ATP-binding protein [Actinomadura barringtoniae]